MSEAASLGSHQALRRHAMEWPKKLVEVEKKPGGPYWSQTMAHRRKYHHLDAQGEAPGVKCADVY
eukprot:5815632-Pleurochrysis_carterae.AAC.4